MATGTFDLWQFLALSSWLIKVNLIEAYDELTDWFVVDFREAIRAIIPSLVDLLKDGDWNVRLVAISFVVKLAEHGEFDWGI
jgi:hypothetical protein